MFLKILMEDDKEKMKKFIVSNGKKPKPASPVYFIPKEGGEDERRNSGNDS